jgi:UDP-glucose 4-epimerase
METVLVTGGAGYVGSHAVRELLDRGYAVVVLDDLSQGHREAVPRDVPLVEASLLDAAAVTRDLRRTSVRCGDALRCAFARGRVDGEPLALPPRQRGRGSEPDRGDRARRCRSLRLSSTANLFGTPKGEGPIAEDAEITPGSPYGESKQSIERILFWADRVYGLRSAVSATSTPRAPIPTPTSARITSPRRTSSRSCSTSLEAARPSVTIFGEDYPRPTAPAFATTCTSAISRTRTCGSSSACASNSCVYNLGNAPATRCGR